jgi:hypothetical protein
LNSRSNLFQLALGRINRFMQFAAQKNQNKGYINVTTLGWVLEALHLVLASFLA